MKKLIGYLLLTLLFIAIIALCCWSAVVHKGESIEAALWAALWTVLTTLTVLGIVSLSVKLISSDE